MFLISNRHCRSLSFFFIYVDFHRRHLCDYYHVRNKLCHEYVNVLVYDWLTTLEIFSYVGLLTTVYIQNLTQTSLVDYFMEQRAASIAVLRTPPYCAVV